MNIENMPGSTFRAINRIFFKCFKCFKTFLQNFSHKKVMALVMMQKEVTQCERTSIEDERFGAHLVY